MFTLEVSNTILKEFREHLNEVLNVNCKMGDKTAETTTLTFRKQKDFDAASAAYETMKPVEPTPEQ